MKKIEWVNVMREDKRSAMEERIELSLLYDFYGALLKENQQRMFEAYMMDDYGYSEIAAEEGISRQGAYDAVSRASKQLRGYEEKLGLVKRFQKQQILVEQLQETLYKLSIPEDTPGWHDVMRLLEHLIQEESL